MQLHQPDVLRGLEALDAHMLVVSFAERERLRGWIPFFRHQFLEPSYEQRGLALSSLTPDPLERTRFLSDATRATYRAYGLDRNAVWRVYGPGIIVRYLKWAVQGKPIRIRDDTLQRGGDFVVGRDGLLTLAHTGRDQSDRPATDAILTALARR